MNFVIAVIASTDEEQETFDTDLQEMVTQAQENVSLTQEPGILDHSAAYVIQDYQQLSGAFAKTLDEFLRGSTCEVASWTVLTEADDVPQDEGHHDF